MVVFPNPNFFTTMRNIQGLCLLLSSHLLQVIVFSPAKWDMDNVPQNLVMRTTLLVMERLLEDEETQVHGVAIFEMLRDLTFVKLIQFTQTDLARKGVGFKILQVSKKTAGACVQLPPTMAAWDT